MKITLSLVLESIKQSLLHLTPQAQVKNPVMFVTYLTALFATVYTCQEHFHNPLHLQVAVWLWITVLFANFAESLASNCGKAQARALRNLQQEILARKIVGGEEQRVHSSTLQKGDLVLCKAGELIPADGEAIEGIATVDESAITGESAPVIRESGGDRSAVTIGTKVISDQLLIRVTSEVGNSFLDRIIRLVEGAKRQKTPNEIALSILLSALTLIFLLVVSSLKFFSDFISSASPVSLPLLISLLVCLIPTTISALLSAIGIAGMHRLIAHHVIAKSGKSVESAGDIDILILDKTGTITLGNRVAVAFIPAPGIEERYLAKRSQYASLSDETPEGRSIVVLAKEKFNLRAEEVPAGKLTFIPFSAKSRMSGVDLEGISLRKGALDAMIAACDPCPPSLKEAALEIAKKGGTPLLVSENRRLIGVIHLKDLIKGGIRSRFARLRRMGIKTIMVTGDNSTTAAAIAAESGVDDFIAEATPELKLDRIKQEQAQGHLVAMAGDGTNDAPALAQADVGVAMNTGTQASREAGNMVDLDSNPTKMIEIIAIGKQLLMTRGALTTFSIANDLAKYFAIIPALFGTLFMVPGSGQGPLALFDLMHLSTPGSAILSAVIFNALVILLLIPLALKGVSYRNQSAAQLLLRNVLIYGVGGLIAPFIGIKLIDLALLQLGYL